MRVKGGIDPTRCSGCGIGGNYYEFSNLLAPVHSRYHCKILFVAAIVLLMSFDLTSVLLEKLDYGNALCHSLNNLSSPHLFFWGGGGLNIKTHRFVYKFICISE